MGMEEPGPVARAGVGDRGDRPTLNPVLGNSGARGEAARCTQARDHCLKSTRARAAGGGDCCSGVLAFGGPGPTPAP